MYLVLIIIFIVLIVLLFDFARKNRRFSFKNEAPGPLSYPILGGIYLLGDYVHRDLTKLANLYGGIYKIWFGEVFTMVVTDPVIIEEIFVKQSHKFLNRPHAKPTEIFTGNYCAINFSDYHTWKKTKPMVAGHFSKTKLNSISNILIFEKNVNKLLRCMNDNSKNFDPLLYCKRFAQNIIINMIFSKDIPELDDKESIDNSLNRLLISLDEVTTDAAVAVADSFWYLEYPLYKVMKTHQYRINEIKNFIKESYDERLETIDFNNPKDILDQLICINGEDDQNTTFHIIVDLIVGGAETISNVCQWFLLFMSNYKEIQEKLHGEIVSIVGKNCEFIKEKELSKLPYLNAVFREILRVRPPLPLGLPRLSVEDTMINNIFIPKGTQIIPNVWGMGNSEKFVSDPSQFKPERWIKFINDKSSGFFKLDHNRDLNKYYNNLDKVSLPFGSGIRMCMAPGMAEIESKLAMANIILNYRVNSIDNQPISHDELPAITIHPKPFKISLEKRNMS